MNKWETELISCLHQHKEEAAILAFTQGFPVNKQLRLSTSASTTPSMTTPLIFALEEQLFALSEYLIDSGASTNIQDALLRTPLTSAIKAGNLLTLQLLLKQSGNLGYRDRAGNTLLHLAAMSGHLGILRYFIEEHAISIQVKNMVIATQRDETPLMVARIA